MSIMSYVITCRGTFSSHLFHCTAFLADTYARWTHVLIWCKGLFSTAKNNEITIYIQKGRMGSLLKGELIFRDSLLEHSNRRHTNCMEEPLPTLKSEDPPQR